MCQSTSIISNRGLWKRCSAKFVPSGTPRSSFCATVKSFKSDHAIAKRGIHLGLQRVREVLKYLEHPEKAYRRVIVAGTNGKGSVSHFLSLLNTACGVRNGLYTSPHLI